MDMANTAKIFNNSSKPIVAKEIVSEYTNTVSIVNLMDATVKVTGTVTGNLYVFSGAGTVLEVD
ncbi:hypothetical protein QCD71_25015, partial [Sphingomonas sp. PsM26]|nr:hypothetical protein [Sphingomonas sp. PsM26]